MKCRVGLIPPPRKGNDKMAKAFASQGDMTEKKITFDEIGDGLYAFTAEGDPNSGKGLFGQAGKVQALVFMSRRVDYRVKVGNVIQKSAWVVELLEDLGVPDPTDGNVNIAMYSAQSLRNRRLKLS